MLSLIFLIFTFFTYQRVNAKNDSVRDKIYVISDTHINHESLTDEGESLLGLFFKFLGSKDTDARTLIIAGDFLEGWTYEISNPITPFRKIIKNTVLGDKKMTKLLKEILKNQVDIIVVNGNHDHTLKLSDFEVNGIKSQGYGSGFLRVYENEFRRKNYLVRHGHQFDIFNHYSEGDNFHPFGFIHARLEQTRGIYGKGGAFPVGPLVHALRTQMTALTILLMASLDASMDDAMAQSVPILLGGQWPNYLQNFTEVVKEGCHYFSEGSDIKVSKAILKQITFFERYWKEVSDDSISDCFNRNFQSSSCQETYTKLLMSIYYSDGTEYFLSRPSLDHSGLSLVLLGHTHQKSKFIKKVNRKDGLKPLIYVNVGAWVNDQQRTFARIHMLGNHNANEVDICSFTEEEEENYCQVLENILIPQESSTSDDLIPNEWTCSPEQYSDGEICDCECGAFDPDCETPFIPTNCYSHSPYLPTTCNSQQPFQCEYIRLPVPEEWTCEPDLWMNSDHVCFCNCTVFDPICTVAYSISGCPENNGLLPFCMSNEYGLSVCLNLVPNEWLGYNMVDETWECPNRWFGSGDGCDCNCGTITDPDCVEQNNICSC